MKNLLVILVFLPGLALAQTNNYNVLDKNTASIVGGAIDSTTIGSTTPAAGAFTTLSATDLQSQTVTNTAATSGNVNFFDGEYHINPTNPSTAVYAGNLTNCFLDASGATISGGGHVPCNFGYVHVLRSTDLAIGTEGKATISGSGTIVSNAAPIHCGLDDVGAGATVTSLILCNAQITNVHGTLTNATGYQLTIANVPTSPISNLWGLRALEYSTSYAANYLGYECDLNAAANHLCVYAPGTASWLIKGRIVLGALIDDGINQFQLTGNEKITGTLAATGQGAMPLYTGAGAAINAPHMTAGSCTLSTGSCTVNFTGSAAFGSSGSYNCVGNDTGGSAIAVSVQNQSGSQIKIFSGAASDTATYICMGS